MVYNSLHDHVGLGHGIVIIIMVCHSSYHCPTSTSRNCLLPNSLILLMSSASSSTSVALKFSAILEGVTDFGITTMPRWRAKEIHTYAIDTLTIRL